MRFSKRHLKGNPGGTECDAVPTGNMEREVQNLKCEVFQGLGGGVTLNEGTIQTVSCHLTVQGQD